MNHAGMAAIMQGAMSSRDTGLYRVERFLWLALLEGKHGNAPAPKPPQTDRNHQAMRALQYIPAPGCCISTAREGSDKKPPKCGTELVRRLFGDGKG